jgi:hypothetical protein
MTHCFKANGKPNLKMLPDWLSVEYSFDASEPRFYSIWIVPWIAEPALILGTLNFDGSVEGWISHLENLGFEDVMLVSCREFFGTKAERRR